MKLRYALYLSALSNLIAPGAVAQSFDPMIALRIEPPQMPDMAEAAMQMQSLEASWARAERDRAQAEFYRQQTEQMRIRQDQDLSLNIAPHPTSIPQAAPARIAPSPAMQRWLIAAQPRMRLYSDFDEVVFADDAPFTEGVIELMSGSEYAADIAYYLAQHRGELLAIASMTTLQGARAIIQIESQFAGNTNP